MLLAAALAAQLGFVRAEQQHDSALLDTRREARELRTRLEQSAQRMERTGQALAYADREVSTLRGALAHSRATVQELEGLLRDQATSLSEVASDAPPFLHIEFEPVDALGAIVAVAENRGRHTVRIGAAEGRIWLDGVGDDAGTTARALEIPPGGVVEFFEYPLYQDEPERVQAGTSRLDGALCFVHRRVSGTDTQAWVGEYWFQYEPGLSPVPLLHRETRPYAESGLDCGLERVDEPS